MKNIFELECIHQYENIEKACRGILIFILVTLCNAKKSLFRGAYYHNRYPQ